MAVSKTGTKTQPVNITDDAKQSIELHKLNWQGIRKALVFGHADADGHLAAEQTRTNLEEMGVRVAPLIVSAETRNYRFWERTFRQLDYKAYQLVIVVDIMFSPKNPTQSLDAVLSTVDHHPNTQFVIIDHHPLMKPKKRRANLTQVAVDFVYNCCFGKPSDELMVVASICDGEEKAVQKSMTVQHSKRATGVRRAAADVDGFAGSKLLKILRRRQWGFFEALAEEPSMFHKSARGRRTSKGLPSPLLQVANAFEASAVPTLPPARQT